MPSIIYFLMGLLPTFVLKALRHGEAMSQQKKASVCFDIITIYSYKKYDMLKTSVIVIWYHTKN